MHVKSGMVRPPDTIIDPGAVMVHSPDTPPTYPAMMGSGRPVHFAPCANGPIFVGRLILSQRFPGLVVEIAEIHAILG